MIINRKARRRAEKLALTRDERKRVAAISPSANLYAGEHVRGRQAIIQPALKRAAEEREKAAEAALRSKP